VCAWLSVILFLSGAFFVAPSLYVLDRSLRAVLSVRVVFG